MSPQVIWAQLRKVRRRLDSHTPSSENTNPCSPIASPTSVFTDELQQLNVGSTVQIKHQLLGQISSFPVGSFTQLLSGVDSPSHLFEGSTQSLSPSFSTIRTRSDVPPQQLLEQQSQQTSLMGARTSTHSHGAGIYQQGHTGALLQLRESEPSTMQSLQTPETSYGIGTSSASNGGQILVQLDLPSGCALSHGKDVRNDGPDDEDPLVNPQDDVDPGTHVGRGCNHYPDEQTLKASRIEISISSVENKFSPDSANVAISGLLRTLYRGDTQWDNVSKQTRDMLWCAFGMRFRWNDELNGVVADLWEKLNRHAFVYMMSQAKRTWKKEKKRTKWCPINYYHKLVRYWNSIDVIEVALRNSTNRGVVCNAEGQVLKQATTTFTGGSVSMLNRDIKKLGIECTKRGFTLGNYILTHMTTGVDNKRKRKGKKGTETTEVEVGAVTCHEPQWINTACEQILDRYNLLVDEKYKDNPQDKPDVWDPRDEECWAIAAAGPKKGKVIGVSKDAVLEEFGYTNVKRRILLSNVHPTTESVQSTLEKALHDQRILLQGEFDENIQTVNNKFDEERQLLLTQVETSQKMFEHTSKQVEYLMSRFPPTNGENVGDGHNI